MEVNITPTLRHGEEKPPQRYLVIYWKDGTAFIYSGKGGVAEALAAGGYPPSAVDQISHTHTGAESDFVFEEDEWKYSVEYERKRRRSFDILSAVDTMAASSPWVTTPLQGLFDAPPPTPEQREAASKRREVRDEIERHNLKVELEKRIKKDRKKGSFRINNRRLSQHGFGAEQLAREMLGSMPPGAHTDLEKRLHEQRVELLTETIRTRASETHQDPQGDGSVSNKIHNSSLYGHQCSGRECAHCKKEQNL